MAHLWNPRSPKSRNNEKKIAHWADEFSTDAFGEMLAIICKCRASKKKLKNSEFKKNMSSQKQNIQKQTFFYVEMQMIQ